MKIQATVECKFYRVSILANRFNLPMEKARALKAGEEIDVSADKAQALMNAGLAVKMELTPPTESVKTDKDDE